MTRERRLIGWYSERQRELNRSFTGRGPLRLGAWGSILYRTPMNTIVEVTEVKPEGDPSGFDDAQEMGPVYDYPEGVVRHVP